MVPVKVPDDRSSTRPPIMRPQIPPDVSSGVGLGRPATKALPWDRNAVFIVPITVLTELATPTTPPMIWLWPAANPPTIPVVGNVVVQPGAVVPVGMA